MIVGGEGAGRWLGVGRLLRALALSPFVRHRLRPFIAASRREDLLVLKELVEAGKVAPLVDRTYALREAPDAIRHIAAGHARGKVIVTTTFHIAAGHARGKVVVTI